MAKKFRVLQIGNESIEHEFSERPDVHIDFLDARFVNQPEAIINEIADFVKTQKAYDFVLIEAYYSDALLQIINEVIEPFNTYINVFFYNEAYKDNHLFTQKFARPLEGISRDEIINKVKALCYPGQYGDKIGPKFLQPHPTFKGEVELTGNRWLKLQGDFGDDFKPIASLNNNLYYERNKGLDIWPEFKVDGNVTIEVTFRVFEKGSIDTISDTYHLSQATLNQPFVIEPRSEDAFISYNVKAKGTGTLYLGAIHRRWSRFEYGNFLLGGNIYSDKDRNEFIYYFHPGDMKPPLNVYFSGYRTAEGFEGFFMMNKMNAPFLLIGDPRIEGGAFYMGSEEYENAIKQLIIDKLVMLNFKENELILSGLSMGSFGALYYGAQLNPAAIIVGKPLINIGTVAHNMKLLRPEDFGTSIDTLLYLTGGTTDKHVTRLNNRFWHKLQKSDIKDTIYAICYMEDDDYDLYAFNELLLVLSEQQAKVLSRGVPGRHNDDSLTITSWFTNFYAILLEDLFGRTR